MTLAGKSCSPERCRPPDGKYHVSEWTWGLGAENHQSRPGGGPRESGGPHPSVGGGAERRGGVQQEHDRGIKSTAKASVTTATRRLLGHPRGPAAWAGSRRPATCSSEAVPPCARRRALRASRAAGEPSSHTSKVPGIAGAGMGAERGDAAPRCHRPPGRRAPGDSVEQWMATLARSPPAR